MALGFFFSIFDPSTIEQSPDVKRGPSSKVKSSQKSSDTEEDPGPAALIIPVPDLTEPEVGGDKEE